MAVPLVMLGSTATIVGIVGCIDVATTLWCERSDVQSKAELP